MVLEAGTRLGNYEIVELVGKGGMGEVYRARDVRLGRDIAIKLLLEEMSEDPERLERFEREARIIASLNHPNIVTIHSVEHTDGLRFITMEFVDGSTLAELTPPDGLPLSRFFELAQPIAVAVAAAHDQGITHRDLKPENVMVGNDGRVRVLDFGLAKLEVGELPLEDAPTLALTSAGGLLGTVPYMSPEQVQSRPADHRSDIFSLGILFYEMATGKRPFEGESSADLMSAILRDTPTSITDLRADLPRHLARILRRCLEKDPQQRYQSALNLANDLEDLKREVDAGTAMASERPSIVVLPFVNMSADPDQEYFCDGMAEEVINALTQLEGLHVVARTSAFSFKGRNVDVREIGNKLGVRSVLEGSVRKAGDRLRVTAQLINVDDGYHLWSDHFDRQLDDVFAIQDEISASIVETLKVKLGVGSTRTKERTENREVYDLYLRALYYEGLATEQGYRRSIECVERALVLDPDYAAAHAGLSRGYMLLNTYGFSSAEEALPKAEAAAIRAVELDDSLATAHHALGTVRASLHWDWVGAESEFRRAIELNPGLASARYSYALRFLSASGRTREAVAETRRALDIDPLSLLMNRGLGETLYWDRQYDEAIRQFRLTLDLAPDFFLARNLLAAAYTSNDQLEESFQVRCEILRRAGRGNEVEELEAAWAEGGEAGMLRWYIQRALPKAEKAKTDGGGGNRAWSMALLYGRLGEVRKALDWLEEAVRQRGGLVILIKADPWLDSLRSDPRYGKILKTMGLAD